MLTEKQLIQYIVQLEQMRKMLKKHYSSIEDEQSVYSQLALFNIGKAIDGIDDALIGLRGEGE